MIVSPSGMVIISRRLHSQVCFGAQPEKLALRTQHVKKVFGIHSPPAALRQGAWVILLPLPGVVALIGRFPLGKLGGVLGGGLGVNRVGWIRGIRRGKDDGLLQCRTQTQDDESKQEHGCAGAGCGKGGQQHAPQAEPTNSPIAAISFRRFPTH